MTDELERHLEDIKSLTRAIEAALPAGDPDYPAASRHFSALCESVDKGHNALFDAWEIADDGQPDDLNELRRSDDRERAGSMQKEMA